MKFKSIVPVVAALVCLQPVIADEYDDAVSAYFRADYTTAFTVFTGLAEKGNARAQYNLGVMYDKGHGVTQDYAEAVKWYRNAAEQGDARAQHNLGLRYFKGRGVTQDYAESVKWFRKAAEQGVALAQTNFGAMYVNGQGVTQDYTQAHAWFNLAASQGNKTARENRDSIAKRMTPGQIAEAQALASQWAAKYNQ